MADAQVEVVEARSRHCLDVYQSARQMDLTIWIGHQDEAL